MEREAALRASVHVRSPSKWSSKHMVVGAKNGKSGEERGKLTSLSRSTGTPINSAISLFPLNTSPVLLHKHAGTAMLANTRSYSSSCFSNHISTITSSMSVNACAFSRNLGRNWFSIRRIFCFDAVEMVRSRYADSRWYPLM